MLLQVGCNVDAFPAWATKVLALGYSVGRVEEMRRCAGAPGKQGDLLQRRLVRIYTPGTAVDGYLQVGSACRSLRELLQEPIAACGSPCRSPYNPYDHLCNDWAVPPAAPSPPPQCCIVRRECRPSQAVLHWCMPAACFPVPNRTAP